MGWKRRWVNWDRGKRDDFERWPSKSPRRWEQQNHAECNAWREEGSSKLDSNGWGDCYSPVPSWERTFCTFVCRVPWRKICDAKRMMSTFKNVAEWDDSASRDAFENEKKRYLAKINHLPCDLPLPIPYMYVDKVDFDAVIDPEIAADLERSAFNPDNVNKAVSNTPDALAHETVVATGWGEAENSSTNWDRYIEKPASRWGDGITRCDPWGSKTNQSFDANGGDGSWKHGVNWKDQEDPWKQRESWKNGQDRRNSGWSCMNSRYQDDQMGDKSWKNGNSFEKKARPQRTRQQSDFLESRNHQRTSYSGDPWQRENAVS
ncbi:hypothetical protein KSP40_PGU009295 [Platanthera guangdongensis]|uniref:Uncharacterized protein n=1 Tax=Platanthera guangdongensis TaxID=2320717 RepID=A0ABR2LT51_9ASPA